MEVLKLEPGWERPGPPRRRAGRTICPMGACWRSSRAGGGRRPSGPSRSWSVGTGTVLRVCRRASCATRRRPRTPSRPRSSSWRGRAGAMQKVAGLAVGPWLLRGRPAGSAADAREASAARRRARHERMRGTAGPRRTRPPSATAGGWASGGRAPARGDRPTAGGAAAAVVLCDLEGLTHQAGGTARWAGRSGRSRAGNAAPGERLRCRAGPAGPGPLGRGAGGVVAGRGGLRRGGPRPGRSTARAAASTRCAARRRPVCRRSSSGPAGRRPG